MADPRPASADEIDLSILIVGYNSLAFLPDALGAIADATAGCSHEILFTNNGTDASEAFVAANFTMASILPSRGNIGFAAANNYLAKCARGQFLLLLNPDTKCHPGAIAELVIAARNRPAMGVLGGVSTDQAGVPHVMSALEFPTLGRIARGMLGLKPPSLPFASADELLEVDAVSGGFMLIAREVWEAMGGLDERFFLYAEELDFCYRYRANGGKVALVPAARTLHDIGSGNAKSAQRLLFSMRGIASFYRKHFSPSYAVCCLALHWLSCALRFVVWCLSAPFVPDYRKSARAMASIVLAPWCWMGGWKKIGQKVIEGDPN